MENDCVFQDYEMLLVACTTGALLCSLENEPWQALGLVAGYVFGLIVSYITKTDEAVVLAMTSDGSSTSRRLKDAA